MVKIDTELRIRSYKLELFIRKSIRHDIIKIHLLIINWTFGST
jgi:hypothetical protein